MRRKIGLVYYGWWIVTISVLINTLETGIYYLGFSVFFLPMSRDLQISRAVASLPFSLAKLMTAVCSPFMGATVDRWGPSRVLFFGGLCAGLGYLLLNWANNYALFLVFYVFIITPGIQAGLNIPTTVAVSQWFAKKRALALGIASLGFALGGAILTPMVSLAVQKFGWHTAALMIGILVWVVVLPLSTLIRGTPEERGLNPDGEKSSATPQPNPSSQDPSDTLGLESQDFTLKEALKTPTYWFLAVSYGLRGIFGSALSVHLVAIMVWKGLSEDTAGLLVGAYPFLWIPASLIMGWLADRHSKQRIAGLATMISALGLLLMVLWDAMSVWQMLFIFLILSTNEGSWPLGWAMLADQFGRSHFGLLRGSMMTVLNLMGMMAPFYSGWVFDKTHSYLWVVAPVSVVLAAAGLLNWFMPPARPTPRRLAPGEPKEVPAVT